MSISIDHELNECRVQSDQYHQRFETKSGPHFKALLGIGSETATETYPGLSSLPLPHGHHNWYAFREDGADAMSLYFCPPPFVQSFRVDDRRTLKFFDELFREGDGYTVRDSELEAARQERRDQANAVEAAFDRR